MFKKAVMILMVAAMALSMAAFAPMPAVARGGRGRGTLPPGVSGTKRRHLLMFQFATSADATAFADTLQSGGVASLAALFPGVDLTGAHVWMSKNGMTLFVYTGTNKNVGRLFNHIFGRPAIGCDFVGIPGTPGVTSNGTAFCGGGVPATPSARRIKQ